MRLKERHLLERNVSVNHNRKRNYNLTMFFKLDGPMCNCTDIDELFKELLSTWTVKMAVVHRFIEKSLKAVLIHNGNLKPSIPIAQYVHLNKNYYNLKILFQSIRYNKYNWKIYGGLKDVVDAFFSC